MNADIVSWILSIYTYSVASDSIELISELKISVENISVYREKELLIMGITFTYMTTYNFIELITELKIVLYKIFLYLEKRIY